MLISSFATAAAIAVVAMAGVGTASAAHATPPDDPTAAPPAAVSEAQAGLARIVDANRPADPQAMPMTTFDGCPVVARKAIEGGLHDSGFEDRLPAWSTEIRWDEYEQLNPAMVGVLCIGDTDGNIDDQAMGTLTAVFAVDLVSPVTFPDLAAWGMPSGQFAGSTPAAGGELVSECVDEAPAYGCIAVWHSGGLAVGLMVLDDTAAPDQAVVDAMIVDLVPEVLHDLAHAPMSP